MAHELCTSLRQGTFEKFHVRGTPGPGAHDAVTAHAAVRPRSPEYSFGKSARHHSAAGACVEATDAACARVPSAEARACVR